MFSLQVYQTSPVTFVPITRCMGISSGKSLKVCSSDIFLCCRSLILVRLASRAPRSSSKKAGEHLEKGYKGLLMQAGSNVKGISKLFSMFLVCMCMFKSGWHFLNNYEPVTFEHWSRLKQKLIKGKKNKDKHYEEINFNAKLQITLMWSHLCWCIKHDPTFI